VFFLGYQTQALKFGSESDVHLNLLVEAVRSMRGDMKGLQEHLASELVQVGSVYVVSKVFT
jgi:hypothetical protein